MHIPAHNGKFQVVTRFRQAGQDDVKWENTHSLTREEYKSAYDYLNNHNRPMLIAAYTLESGVAAYLDALADVYQDFLPDGKDRFLANSTHGKLEGPAAASKAMLEEFITTFAYPASQNHDKPMAAGLNLTFSRHSVFEASNGGDRIETCPFKNPFAALLNMTLVMDDDGQYKEGPPQHGGLITSLMDIIKNWRQSPPVGKLAQDTI